MVEGVSLKANRKSTLSALQVILNGVSFIYSYLYTKLHPLPPTTNDLCLTQAV